MPFRTERTLMKTSVRFLLIAAGIIALSLTFVTAGLGFGEHLSDPTNCRKCHATIYEEFTTTGAHASITCGDCHQNTDLDYSVPLSFNLTWLDVPADTPHTAVSVECIDCHPHVMNELSNSGEVHARFYEKSMEFQPDRPNAACIACHTHADVELKRTRMAYISYIVSCDGRGYNVSLNGSDDLGSNRTGYDD